MHVSKQVSVMHCFHRVHHVFWIAGIRINWNACKHTSNLKIWIDLMSFFHYQRTCHQFMMHHLIHALFRIFLLLENHTGTSIPKQRILIIFLVVNLIECHPVFYLVPVTFHYSLCIFDKEINYFPVFPTTVCFYKMIRHLKMRQCHDRFNIIFEQFIEQVIVKSKSFFIGTLIVPIWENTCPCNRSTETFESHLCK